MEHDLIQRDPEIMMGKPVVRGTRLTVEHILRQMGDGASQADLTVNYRLTIEQIEAALIYAAEELRRHALADAGITGSVFNGDEGWSVLPV